MVTHLLAVLQFLKAAAAKKRKFQVIICEGAPHFGGHAMARSLASANIETIVINDSAACAIMARVNKVLLPAHAVMANGGLISPSGSHVVALAATQHSVPVVCITGMFKLCPQFPHEGQDTLNDLVSVSSIMSYVEMTAQPNLLGSDDVEYINPIHDYIPPQLINLFVTNIGGFQPSYIYRLLAEYYHSDDWESFE
jgi:translation initiation factor eIF-2B subunit beta